MEPAAEVPIQPLHGLAAADAAQFLNSSGERGLNKGTASEVS